MNYFRSVAGSRISQGLVAGGIALVMLSGCGNDSADAVTDASVESMQKAAEKVTDTVSDSATKLSESLSEGAKQVAEKAGETAQAVATTTGEAAQSAAQAVTDTAAKVVETEADTETEAKTAAPVAAAPESPAKVEPTPEPSAPEPAEPESKPAPVKRTGAHGATVDFFTALLNGDAEAAIAVVEGSDKEKKALTARANYQRASVQFKTAFVNKFGDGAWAKFNSPEHLPEPATSQRPPFNARLSVFEQVDLDQMLLYKPQENGDEASYPAEQGDLKVVKKNGVWKLVAASLLPPGLDGADKATQILTASTSHIARFTKAIGKDGVSADDIDVELGRAIVETLYGFSSQESHRFDVGSL